MEVSSRTPEGTPNRCPVCQNAICIEPSLPFGDAPCPRCGSLLWFIRAGDAAKYYSAGDAEAIREKVMTLLAAQLGVKLETVQSDPDAFIHNLAADSLTVAELVMELEEELH